MRADLVDIIRRAWPHEPRVCRGYLMESEFWAPHIREAGLGLDDPFVAEEGEKPVRKDNAPRLKKGEKRPAWNRNEAFRDGWLYMTRRERQAHLTGEMSAHWAPIIQETGVSLRDPHLKRPKPPKPTPEEIEAIAEEWRVWEQEIVDRGLTPSWIDIVRGHWTHERRAGRKRMMTMPRYAMVIEALGLELGDPYIDPNRELKEREKRIEREWAERAARMAEGQQRLAERLRDQWTHVPPAERERMRARHEWTPILQGANVALDDPYLPVDAATAKAIGLLAADDYQWVI